MASPFWIGNDIVDFASAELKAKAGDPDFLDRVLGPEERRWVQNASEGEKILWGLWSAKEAAFKIGRKVLGALPFSPKKWRVEGPPAEGLWRWARWDELRVGLRWECGEDWVHCWATLDPEGGGRIILRVEPFPEGEGDPEEEELAFFSPSERQSIYSRASLKVRKMAKDLFRDAGYGEVEILRLAPREPPRVHREGRLLRNCDLSLSHDGRFCAAVVSLG